MDAALPMEADAAGANATRAARSARPRAARSAIPGKCRRVQRSDSPAAAQTVFPEVLAVAILTAADGRAQWYITQKSGDMRGEDGTSRRGCVARARASPRQT